MRYIKSTHYIYIYICCRSSFYCLVCLATSTCTYSLQRMNVFTYSIIHLSTRLRWINFILSNASWLGLLYVVWCVNSVTHTHTPYAIDDEQKYSTDKLMNNFANIILFCSITHHFSVVVIVDVLRATNNEVCKISSRLWISSQIMTKKKKKTVYVYI